MSDLYGANNVKMRHDAQSNNEADVIEYEFTVISNSDLAVRFTHRVREDIRLPQIEKLNATLKEVD